MSLRRFGVALIAAASVLVGGGTPRAGAAPTPKLTATKAVATTPTKKAAGSKAAARPGPAVRVASRTSRPARDGHATLAPAATTATAKTEPATLGSKVARPAKAEAVKPAKTAKANAKPAPPPPPPCFNAPVSLQRGTEEERFALTRCDGTFAPLALERVSILARPNMASRAPLDVAALARQKSRDLGTGLRRLEGGLLSRLQQVVSHFAAPPAAAVSGRALGASPPPRVILVSGYRPGSHGSYHQKGDALDFRLDGVANEALVAFCKTLPDTGCGYYPNSSFVHLDVRAPGAGHVAWIDGSGPGEVARYVATWPPPPSDTRGGEGSDALGRLLAALDAPAEPGAHEPHPVDATSVAEEEGVVEEAVDLPAPEIVATPEPVTPDSITPATAPAPAGLAMPETVATPEPVAPKLVAPDAPMRASEPGFAPPL